MHVSDIDVMGIQLGGIKSKLQKEFYKAFSLVQKNPATIYEYAKMEDKMIMETTDLTQEQIDDMLIEKRAMLVGRIIESFNKGTVFQKTSMTQPDSSRPDTQTS